MNYNYKQYDYPINNYDDRFLLGPFLVGGLTGGLVGYGLGSNKNQTFYPVYPIYPQCMMPYQQMPQQVQPYMTYTNSNNYYY